MATTQHLLLFLNKIGGWELQEALLSAGESEHSSFITNMEEEVMGRGAGKSVKSPNSSQKEQKFLFISV